MNDQASQKPPPPEQADDGNYFLTFGYESRRGDGVMDEREFWQLKYLELYEEKKVLEGKLRDLNQRYRQIRDIAENIIQSMTTGLIITDIYPRRIRYFNKAMERISSIPASEAVGRTIEDVLGERQGIPYELFYRLTEEQGRVEKMDLKIIRKDGQVVYRRVKVETLYDQRKGQRDGLLIFVEDLNETEFIKEAFRRYVPEFILEQAIEDGYHIKMEGKRQELTVLVVDIREFSQLTEEMVPEDIVSMLNYFFQLITDIIFHYHGWVDKFMGDSLMALFGVPIYQADSALRAVLAAKKIVDSLNNVSIYEYPDHIRHLQVGIGINTGSAVVGNMGSEHRLNYTAIGDTVNLAFRIQDLANKGEILMGENTFQQVRDRVIGRQLGPIRIKGRKKPIRLYALEDIHPGADRWDR